MQPAPEASALALRIFAVVPNSAAQERLFSSYGNIQSKKRTRLTVQRTFDLARVKASLPRPKRAPVRFVLPTRALRSASSNAEAPADPQEVEAAVDETAAQLTHPDTLRG